MTTFSIFIGSGIPFEAEQILYNNPAEAKSDFGYNLASQSPTKSINNSSQ